MVVTINDWLKYLPFHTVSNTSSFPRQGIMSYLFHRYVSVRVIIWKFVLVSVWHCSPVRSSLMEKELYPFKENLFFSFLFFFFYFLAFCRKMFTHSHLVSSISPVKIFSGVYRNQKGKSKRKSKLNRNKNGKRRKI